MCVCVSKHRLTKTNEYISETQSPEEGDSGHGEKQNSFIVQDSSSRHSGQGSFLTLLGMRDLSVFPS